MILVHFIVAVDRFSTSSLRNNEEKCNMQLEMLMNVFRLQYIYKHSSCLLVFRFSLEKVARKLSSFNPFFLLVSNCPKPFSCVGSLIFFKDPADYLLIV